VKRSAPSKRLAVGDMAGMAGDGIRGVAGGALAITVTVGGVATTVEAGAGIVGGAGTAAGMVVGTVAGMVVVGTVAGTAVGTAGNSKMGKSSLAYAALMTPVSFSRVRKARHEHINSGMPPIAAGS
jgi:hypothetical protein